MPFIRNGESKISPFKDLKRDKATYACPGRKTCETSSAALSKVNPWLLCTVIAHANFIG